MKAVFNSSPVIILSKLNLLEASFSLFKKNYVPSGVIDEITFGENKDEEAILLALEINSDNDYVILDDKAARNRAISYGLNVKRYNWNSPAILPKRVIRWRNSARS